MEFYLVYTESAQFAGGGQWFITKAKDANEAEMLVEPEANAYWYETDLAEIQKSQEEFDEDEVDAFEECACSIMGGFVLTAESLKKEAKEYWVDILSKPGLGNSVELVDCTEEEVIKAAEKVQLDLVG